jgi:hypothetical protein
MLPFRAQNLISEYSRPITRPDWRNGSICNEAFKHNPVMINTFNVLKKRIRPYNYDNLCDLILDKGDDFVFQMYPYSIEYNNFYFYLCSEDNAFLNRKPILKKTHKTEFL